MNFDKHTQDKVEKKNCNNRMLMRKCDHDHYNFNEFGIRSYPIEPLVYA